MSTIRNQPGHDDPGRFLVVDRALESLPGTDIGLFWCAAPTPPDFILKLEWLHTRQDDNSGVFIRFPDPESKGFNNTAFVGVQFAFEVQIDKTGAPDGAGLHKTSAIYAEPDQQLSQVPARPPGEWNQYEIHAKGQTYTVFLNGNQVTKFQNPHQGRGLPSITKAPPYLWLQTHTGRVLFRNICVKVL